MGDLKGQRVVVIGGTSGIGFAVAQAALAADAAVSVGSSGPKRVATAVERLGDGADGCAIDVTNDSSVEAFFRLGGPIDHLVFTAGDWGQARTRQTVAELDLDAVGAVSNVRFLGALRVIKYAAASLTDDASITLTNGAIAHRPRPGAVVSSAMAGATEHLTRALAVDLAPVRVNCVCPGYVETEVWDSMPEDQRAEFLRAATEGQPIARAAAPAEVAEAYLYFMRGTYSTGQVLIADGGMTLV